ALASQLEDLEDEILEYETLRAGQLSTIKVETFDELADGLIKARIAAGLSQKQLADRLGVKEQQIQRYESERYASASLQRLQD
ncbi:helix-turn-helix transcriptional regulator, partial [Klebsiella pneumoniae]|uniref:helix-turn-helix transcriptional regulator n=1 Tax=Klebsiella pneumoniae TaxID=573 RepID=UPI0038539DD2